MSDAVVFDIPMELSLDFLPVIGSYIPDMKRELGKNAVDKVCHIDGCLGREFLLLSSETEDRTSDLWLGFNEMSGALAEGNPREAHMAGLESILRMECQVMAPLIKHREVTTASFDACKWFASVS